ncbi:MAG: choice-of-anchor D domain-containing protein [Nitrospirae bacterium]|nr:choice-of-anchor D domain-containing protein [Nitrospirota bacterium]
MKKALIAHVSILTFLALVLLSVNAGAFPTYSSSGGSTGNCANCHGAFASGPTPYVSQHDGVAWKNPATGANLSIHDGHRTYMLNSDCNVCHTGSSRTPVYLGSSNGGTGFQTIGCTGCHNGDGLRAHHENSGAYTCYDCHSPGTPPAENVPLPYYFTPDAAHPNKPTDPCNANGSESAVAPAFGLDNDGNLLYDAADPACTPSAPVLSVSPTTLTFGDQTVGTTSATQTVTISNTGNASLTVNSITNSNTTDFSMTTPATPFDVGAGASQTFTGAFTPATTGTKSATISISSNGGSASVSASGSGTPAPAPVLSVSPTALSFGSQTVGTTSAAQTVTISNTGTGTLNVTSITSSSTDFKFSPSTISPIAPGGSASLSVTFAPATTGAKSGTINITSDGGSGSVSATGTGAAQSAPVLSVSPTTLSFGNQTVGTTSAAQTVTVSNTGNATLTVSGITNGNTTDFVLTAPATPFTVNAGASQTFTVAFKPATTGTKSATISIASDGGSASVSATGTGAAQSAPVLSVSPTTLSFGSQTVGTTSSAQTVTISNTGTATLNIANIAQAGSSAFSFSPASLSPIEAGASATLTVTYSPTAAVTDSGSLTITSDGGSATVTLSGSGVTAGSGSDVSLVKLLVPGKAGGRVGGTSELKLVAYATSTAKEEATVTLTAAAGEGVTVNIEHPSITEEVSAQTQDGSPDRRRRSGLDSRVARSDDRRSGDRDTQGTKFAFEAKVVCTKSGTWPITWTATISADQNSNLTNDTLTGTTTVVCSSSRRGRDD